MAGGSASGGFPDRVCHRNERGLRAHDQLGRLLRGLSQEQHPGQEGEQRADRSEEARVDADERPADDRPHLTEVIERIRASPSRSDEPVGTT